MSPWLKRYIALTAMPATPEPPWQHPGAHDDDVDCHRGEGPPQPGDAGLQRMSGVAGRAVAVEVVDQRVGGDDPEGAGEQEREECPQRRSTDSHLAAVVVPGRRRAEDPEPHPNILPRASTGDP